MSKGTVIYIGGFELPDKNAAAHRVLNNGKMFRELGYDVVYIGISHTKDTLTAEHFEGFECWSIPYPKSLKQWGSYLISFKHVAQIASKINNLKGIIFYNYQAVALARGLTYCKKNKIWSIVDVTEWYLTSRSNIIFFLIKQLDTSLRMRLLNTKADGIITISSFLTQYYNRRKCKNIIQIPPLVDKSDLKWKQPAKRTEFAKIRMVYAGSPGDIKDNLLIVLKSVYNFRDIIELHILGIEQETFVKQFAGVGEGAITGEHIVFHGRVPHQECILQIKDSDFQIFIRPDNLVTRAGFPTKFGESLACGTPVITNLSSNISDYLKEGENGFVVSEVSDTQIVNVLNRASSLSRQEIAEMKKFCADFDMFDYHYHIKAMDFFLNMIKLGDRE